MSSRNFVEKWSVLAALRFFLASIVAVNHMPEFVPLGPWAWIPKLGAFEAILGFLLISGYSIGASYQKEPDGFLWRRVKRIYPVYVASLLLVYLVHAIDHTGFAPLWELLANLLFLNQIVTSTSLVGPAWSLALEFWLYCLTPLLFRLSDRTLQRLIIASFVAFCLYTCGRTLLHWDYYAGTGFGLNLLLLSFVWLAGLRLARLPAQSRAILTMVGVLFAIHMALSAAIQAAFRFKHSELLAFVQTDLPGLLMQAGTLGFVTWIFVRLFRPAPTGAAPAAPSALMRVLGDISFPLYLIHIPIYALLRRSGLSSPVLYFLIAVACSWLVYRMLDLYSQRRHAVPAVPARVTAPTKLAPK